VVLIKVSDFPRSLFASLSVGILKHWNTGILEQWNIGILEQWNIGRRAGRMK
jgi:hypothetical protein